MKKIEQYLLERYPLIWNTKLVQMLFFALCAHVFFFLWGFSRAATENPKYTYYNITELFWGTPVILTFIISLLLLVYWLMQLSKNNAFKNFYPSSPLKLFWQFIQYFIIVFACISFYISFVLGVKTYININWQGIEEVAYMFQIGFMELIKYSVISFLLTAVSIALLVLCIRITNIRTLLLTIVFSGVMSLVLGLFSIILGLSGGAEVIAWLYILTYVAIAIASISVIGQVSKLISGILINFTLLLFIPAFSATVLVLTKENIKFIPASYLSLGVALVFVAVYTPVLHKWKATPE